MATPEGFVKVQEKMQALQEKVESGLRPALAKQFRSMADCMDRGGSTQQIESCVQSAQSQVVGLQKQMDEVVQSFGMAIQTGTVRIWMRIYQKINPCELSNQFVGRFIFAKNSWAERS